MTYDLLTYGTPGAIKADDAAQANAAVLRDGNGDTYANTINAATGLANSGFTQLQVVTKTAAYTAANTETILLADATSAAFTITLPAASTVTNRLYIIKKIDSSANAVTIAVTGTAKIDGASTASLAAQYDVVRLVSDGTNWFKL